MKIGLLDYQLTNYHIKKFHGILTGPLGAGTVTLTGASELEPTEQGRQWCAENGVRYVESAEEVIAASDALICLAPNNPEKHLELARPALASGKPVFIDKVLAHTVEDAQQIISLAQQGKSPVMSSSSLRFALELDEMDQRIQAPVESIFARGLGKFPIYGIHTVCMATRYLGAETIRVIDTGDEAARLLTLDTGKLKAAVELRESENQYEATPWQVGVLAGGRYEVATIKNFDGFYENLMRNALEFFRTGESPITIEEQLSIVQILAAADQSLAEGNAWVSLEKGAAVGQG